MADKEQSGHDLVSHIDKPDPHTGYVLESLYNALGNLVVGTENGPIVLVLDEHNGYVLTVDRYAEGGVSWKFLDMMPLSVILAKGDLVVGKATLNPQRLPVGPDGYVLTADSSAELGVSWQPNTGVVYSPSLDFSDERNSQYIGAI